MLPRYDLCVTVKLHHVDGDCSSTVWGGKIALKLVANIVNPTGHQGAFSKTLAWRRANQVCLTIRLTGHKVQQNTNYETTGSFTTEGLNTAFSNI